ncbi:MAG: twin arginine-targeting protein translocase TatC [Lentisphaerae bacterium GWF2_44_16]|nr:MAG: twin arginine-targeting protein translocase TatC [Lentisphaerae bacterium GWF2_44_16]
MDERTYTLIEHLDELRSRIIKCAICIAIFFPFCYYISMPSIIWVKRTFCPELKELVYLQPLELFFTQLKVSFYMSLILGVPCIAYHIWKFSSPALFHNEKKYIKRFVFISTALFIIGASFALFLVYPALIRFSISMGSSDIVPMLNIQSVINLAAMLMLGFGIVFQLPVIVFLLAKTGLVKTETMSKGRPYIIVAIFLVAAVLTPGPDVLSQLAMAIPSLILFEISLFLAKLSERKRKKLEENN